jgi:hypothetical protein
MNLPCTEIKKQTELWFYDFSTVYLYKILLGFCAEWHWFGNIVATLCNRALQITKTIVSTGGSNWQIAINHRLTRDHKYLHKTCTIYHHMLL